MAEARLAGKGGSMTMDTVTVLGLKSWEISGTGDVMDTTGMDSGDPRTFIAGLTTGTLSGEAFFDLYADPHAAAGPEILAGADIAFSLNMTTNLKYTGQCIVTRWTMTCQLEGAIGYTFEATIDGAITTATATTTTVP